MVGKSRDPSSLTLLGMTELRAVANQLCHPERSEGSLLFLSDYFGVASSSPSFSQYPIATRISGS